MKRKTTRNDRWKPPVCGKGLMPIASALPNIAVTAHVHDPVDGTYQTEVEFLDLSNQLVTLRVPRSKLAKQGELLGLLEDRGYEAPLDPNRRIDLARRLARSKPTQMRTVVHQTGWTEDDRHYVFPERTFGPNASAFIYRPSTTRALSKHPLGDLKSWTRGIAKPAAHSVPLVFAISVAFAGMLAKPLGVESGGFHLFRATASGNTSSFGKTLCQRVAQSVYSSAAQTDLAHWDSSPAGLEGAAVAANDGLLALDEIGRGSSDRKVIAGLAQRYAMMLAGGQGRILDASYRSQHPAKWHLLVLSSGEYGISAVASQTNTERLKGEEVRLIDVPIDAHPDHGIFSSLPSRYETSTGLVKALERRLGKHFGHPSRAFIQGYMADQPRLTRIARQRMKEFHRKAEVPTVGWEYRFGNRFALAYAAASVGIHLDILPWKRDQAFDAIAHCYRSARKAVPDPEGDMRLALGRLRRLLKTRTRVVDLRPEANQPSAKALRKAVGFIKHADDGTEICAIKRSEFERLVGPLSPEVVFKRLQQDHHLVTTSRRSSWKQIMIKGLAETKLPYACIRTSFAKAKGKPARPS